jgi:hypothetical protein
MDREQELRMMLVELKREYDDRAAPIVKELAEIEAKKSPRPLFMPVKSMSLEEFRKLYPSLHDAAMEDR